MLKFKNMKELLHVISYCINTIAVHTNRLFNIKYVFLNEMVPREMSRGWVHMACT